MLKYWAKTREVAETSYCKIWLLVIWMTIEPQFLWGIFKFNDFLHTKTFSFCGTWTRPIQVKLDWIKLEKNLTSISHNLPFILEKIIELPIN